MKGDVQVEFLVGFPVLIVFFLFLLQSVLLWTGKVLLAYSGYSAKRIVAIHPSEVFRARDHVGKLLSVFGGSYTLTLYNQKEDKVEEVGVDEEFIVEIRWDFPLNVPIVNAFMGKKGSTQWFLPLTEKIRGRAEPCPGWEKGECKR